MDSSIAVIGCATVALWPGGILRPPALSLKEHEVFTESLWCTPDTTIIVHVNSNSIKNENTEDIYIVSVSYIKYPLCAKIR